MFENPLQILISALAGTLVSAGIAKAYIAKSLKDLEAALSMCGEIKIKLAEVKIQLSCLDQIKSLLHEHDRKIVSLEARKSVRKNGHYQDSAQ